MAKADPSAHPIQTLRENTTALEAAILLCLAKPRKKAVHTLRTTTRRIEAQLQLLALLPHLPSYDKPRRQALRLLKKLRRAAGRVRDLDVQRDLVGNETAGTNRPNPSLRKEARTLRRELKHKRGDEASRLQKLLEKHRTRLPLIFEELLDALAPAESLALTESQLTGLIRSVYLDAGDSQPPTADVNDTAALHAIRKRAKLARYLAESAPASATAARQLATRFEKLQVAGGHWHDWLLLTDVATDELGHSAKLPSRFAAHTRRSLRTFKRRLGPPLPDAQTPRT